MESPSREHQEQWDHHHDKDANLNIGELQRDLALYKSGQENAIAKFKAARDIAEDRLRLISDYQRALRKVDECCGCLNYDNIFRLLDRGTPDEKCEDCNREKYRCDCHAGQEHQQTEKQKCLCGADITPHGHLCGHYPGSVGGQQS